MSLLDTIGQIISAPIQQQVTAAESEAQTIAQAVAVWGAIVVVELGILIFLLARKSKL